MKGIEKIPLTPAHGNKSRQYRLYYKAFMRLNFSLTDCHIRSDFDHKSSYAHFEGRMKAVPC